MRRQRSVYPLEIEDSHLIPLTSFIRLCRFPGPELIASGQTWSPSDAKSRQVLDHRLLEVVCGSSKTTATTSARRKISLWDLPHACQLPSSNSRHFRVPKVSVLAHERIKHSARKPRFTVWQSHRLSARGTSSLSSHDTRMPWAGWVELSDWAGPRGWP